MSTKLIQDKKYFLDLIIQVLYNIN